MAEWNAQLNRFEYEEGELDTQIADAMRRTAEAEAQGEFEPSAKSVRFEKKTRRFVVELTNGTIFIFPADLCQGLKGEADDALAEVAITPSGLALHWPRLDNDFSIAGLMMGSLGGKTWMKEIRRELLRRAVHSKSPAKSAAARENGKKGGRPRKIVAQAVPVKTIRQQGH